VCEKINIQEKGSKPSIEGISRVKETIAGPVFRGIRRYSYKRVGGETKGKGYIK
jgi:hypothetical protein